MKNLYAIFMIILLPSLCKAELQVAKIFSDHMIIQRDEKVPVWGWATPNAQISVTFIGKKYTTTTQKDGHWEVILPKTPAGGPYSILIQGEGQTLTIKDVFAGDVWLCSGQSNMEWTVKNSNHADTEIQQANNDLLRHFKIPRTYANHPEATIAGGSWTLAKNGAVADFTAVGYFFAKHINKTQNIPIGLINSSWGGSRIEPWMRAEVLGYKNTDEAIAIIKATQKQKQQELLNHLKSYLKELPEEEIGLASDGSFLWKHPEFNDTSWSTMELPSLWENQGLEGLDGVVWFRKSFDLPAGSSAEEAILNLGPIDDTDKVWINGHLVGGLQQSYNVNRVYPIPKKYLRQSGNTISIRVEDTGGGGGIYGKAESMQLTMANHTISLAGLWKYKVALVSLPQNGGQVHHLPTLLYNKMIHPLHRFPIKGVLWYQGESNAGKADAFTYRKHFKNMIQDWRKQWNTPSLPFLYVQLANFMQAVDHPTKSNWAMLRESQSDALKLRNTAQAVIIDIGETNDIHPRNKQDVGYRLALAAQKLVYNKAITYSGPTLRKSTIKGNKVILEFDHIGNGLLAKGNTKNHLYEFTIAGADQQFIRAQAVIAGNKVEVWSSEISKPVAVRYAWADNPDKANFYNKEGLPASPFRTDNWAE